MKPRIRLFALLLLAQLGLAGGIYWSGPQAGEQHSRQPLLDSPADAVERLQISDGQGSAVLLRTGDSWSLPGLPGSTADAARVEAALAGLAQVDLDWPVTATSGSHARFEVAADKFQRRLLLERGGQVVAEFYLGTSPGFRQVHLRRAGEDEVYAVELKVSDFPASDDDWQDQSMSQSDAVREVNSIEPPVAAGEPAAEARPDG